MSLQLNANQQAQVSHVGWGLALMLLSLKFPRVHPAYWAATLSGLAGFKEVVVDPLTETVQMQVSGWEDFGLWLFGIWVGYLIVVIR